MPADEHHLCLPREHRLVRVGPHLVRGRARVRVRVRARGRDRGRVRVRVGGRGRVEGVGPHQVHAVLGEERRIQPDVDVGHELVARVDQDDLDLEDPQVRHHVLAVLCVRVLDLG